MSPRQPPAPIRTLALPEGAEGPVHVYVNGERWTEGRDFEIRGGAVHFSRTLRPRPALGVGRSIMLAIGIGVYGDLAGDTLDLQYRVGGTTHMVNVPLRPGTA